MDIHHCNNSGKKKKLTRKDLLDAGDDVDWNVAMECGMRTPRPRLGHVDTRDRDRNWHDSVLPCIWDDSLQLNRWPREVSTHVGSLVGPRPSPSMVSQARESQSEVVNYRARRYCMFYANSHSSSVIPGWFDLKEMHRNNTSRPFLLTGSIEESKLNSCIAWIFFKLPSV